jgi:hypothetical protein
LGKCVVDGIAKVIVREIISKQNND